MKFRKVNSFSITCTSEELENIFNEIKHANPSGFTSDDLQKTVGFSKARKKSSYTGYNVRSYAKNLLLQRFKTMGLTTYNNLLNIWVFNFCIVSISVDEIIGQMQSLEAQLINLGYSKTESAIYEKTEVVSITV